MLTVINVFDQICQVVSVSGVDVNPDQNRVSSDQMCQLSDHSIHRGALWILGEYCTTVDDISRVVQEIRVSLGEVGHVTVM